MGWGPQLRTCSLQLRLAPPADLDNTLLWREDFINANARAQMAFEFLERAYQSMGYWPALRSADVIPVRELPESMRSERRVKVEPRLTRPSKCAALKSWLCASKPSIAESARVASACMPASSSIR